MNRQSVLVVSPLVLVLGCVSTADKHADKRDTVRGRAAVDLDCPAEQIAVIDLDPSTVSVQGCGRSARYRVPLSRMC
jgi:hypothetical protein